MKKKSVAFISAAFTAIFLGAYLTSCSQALDIPKEKTLQKALEEGGYTLVFEDDFDGDGIDYEKWKTGLGYNPRRAGYYEDSEDTLFVSDGCLTIRTLYKDGQYGEGWYTSWIESSTGLTDDGTVKSPDYKGFSSTYGYFEIRCKVPPAIGIWSAFWLMPDGAAGMSADDVQGTGADGVEIDIMESPWYYSLTDKEANMHVLHGDGYENTKSEKSPLYRVPDMYTQFHTYGVMWTEEEYVFYIDGAETWRTKHTVDGKTFGVSQVDQYMILSVEVAGYADENGVPVEGKNQDGSNFWCGNPARNDKSKHYDFVVDYVRVYRAADNAA